MFAQKVAWYSLLKVHSSYKFELGISRCITNGKSYGLEQWFRSAGCIAITIRLPRYNCKGNSNGNLVSCNIAYGSLLSCKLPLSFSLMCASSNNAIGAYLTHNRYSTFLIMVENLRTSGFDEHIDYSSHTQNSRTFHSENLQTFGLK